MLRASYRNFPFRPMRSWQFQRACGWRGDGPHEPRVRGPDPPGIPPGLGRPGRSGGSAQARTYEVNTLTPRSGTSRWYRM